MGPAVAKLAAAMGTPLMPWQHRVVDTALEVDARGVYRYAGALITVPRQSGKTTLLRPVTLHRCLTIPRASTWLTAQTRNDARDTWEQTVEVIEMSPLGKLTAVRRTNGSEALTVKATRGRFRVFAPGETALHGKTTHLVAVDEVWAFTLEDGAALDQAIIPTQVTVPGAQIWRVSTLGNGRSGWLRRMIDAERAKLKAGEPSRIAFFDWGVPDDEDPSDVATVIRHHPAVGHTIGPEAIQSAYEMIGGGAEFARAYGNVWVSTDTYVVVPAVWDRARLVDVVGTVGFTGRVAFGVEVHADRSGAVIVAAGHTADGRQVLEVVDDKAGLGWVLDRLLELCRKYRPLAVVIDPYGPGRSVHAALTQQRRIRPPIHEDYTAGDFVMACGELLDGLVDGTVRHRSHAALDRSVEATAPRMVREQVAFSREMTADGGSPAALIAAALALYGLRHPPDRLPVPALHTA